MLYFLVKSIVLLPTNVMPSHRHKLHSR